MNQKLLSPSSGFTVSSSKGARILGEKLFSRDEKKMKGFLQPIKERDFISSLIYIFNIVYMSRAPFTPGEIFSSRPRQDTSRLFEPNHRKLPLKMSTEFRFFL